MTIEDRLKDIQDQIRDIQRRLNIAPLSQDISSIKYDKFGYMLPLKSAWDELPQKECFGTEPKYLCHPSSEWVRWALRYESELKNIPAKDKPDDN